jgi:hypothetical protein
VRDGPGFGILEISFAQMFFMLMLSRSRLTRTDSWISRSRPSRVMCSSYFPRRTMVLCTLLLRTMSPSSSISSNRNVNPFYTTFVTPLSVNDPKKSKSIEHTGATKIQKWVPGPLRGRSDILDQVIGGYASHTRGEQSKISVQSTKGKVVIGYRETRDEETAKAMGLKVGVLEQQQRKKKHWWSA